MTAMKKAVKAILQSKSIVIACHVNPDGDCIGSLLALGLGLASIGKRVYMVSDDGVPGKYQKLPGAGKIRKTAGKKTDMAITVDCNAREMVGKPFDAIKKAKYILEIDHHEFRKPFGNLFLIDTKASAVGEIIYRLLKYLNVDITKDIAQNILTSIIVETNSFRLPAVRALTFQVCADLIKTGINFSRLSEIVYWSKTKEGAVLSGQCMANLKVIQKGKIAWSLVTRKDFIKTKGKKEDVDTVANDMLSINTVKIAIFFREQNAKFLRVSLRSKGKFNVASIAGKYGGGGHFDSAGCHIANTKKEIAGVIEAAKWLLK
jgi:bifunctional oligoribonuclease and PAP phosphatase NrnA